MALQAQQTSSKSIQKDYDNIDKITINHRRGPVHIKPSSDGLVHLYAEITVTAKKSEQADKALALIDIDAIDGAGRLSTRLDTKFEACTTGKSWKKMKKSFFGKRKDDPMDVDIEDYRVELTLEVPELQELSVENKYEPVQIDVEVDQLEIIGFESDATVSKDVGNTRVRSKYSTITMRAAGRVDMQLFECEYEAKTIGDLDLNAKYSDIKLSSCGDIKVDGFENDMEIGQFGRIRGDMKYSSLTRVSSCGEVDLVLFECDLSIEQVGDLSLTDAKYSDFEVGQVGRLRGNGLFECDFDLGAVATIDLSGKYSTIEAEEIQESVRFEGFEGALKSQGVSENVKDIRIAGKYMKVELPLERNYSLHLDLRSSKVYYYRDGNRQSKEGELTTVLSSDTDAGLEVHLSGYSMNANLVK